MKSKRLNILLDIDDTAIIYSKQKKTWNEHPQLKELIKLHAVILYSGNPDISEYHTKWKTSGFIPKGGNDIPTADVLIDNDYELWITTVNVKKGYSSITQFLKYNK